jgi:hypothetical protein
VALARKPFGITARLVSATTTPRLRRQIESVGSALSRTVAAN